MFAYDVIYKVALDYLLKSERDKILEFRTI